MPKNRLLAVAIVSAFALPGIVLAEDAPAPASPHTFTGNVGFTSNYIFRGVSQTWNEPAIQGGFDYSHSSGLYLGTWGSNVSGNQYTNASMEWDFYGGYNGKINDDLGYTAGLIYVVYPGGKTSVTPPDKKWDTAELNAGISWKWLSAKVSYTLTNWYGIGKDGGFIPVHFATGVSSADDPANPDDSKGSIYTELNFAYELPAKVNLIAHLGHQKIENYKELDYTDWKIGVAKEYFGFNFAAAYTDTNVKDYTLYHFVANGDDKELANGKFFVTVSKTF